MIPHETTYSNVPCGCVRNIPSPNILLSGPGIGGELSYVFTAGFVLFGVWYGVVPKFQEGFDVCVSLFSFFVCLSES